MESVASEMNKTKKDDSTGLLGRKKGTFTTNTTFADFNETIHITYLDPQ